MPGLGIKSSSLATLVVSGFSLAFAEWAVSRGPEPVSLAVSGACFLLFCLLIWRSIAALDGLRPLYINSDYMDTRLALPVILTSLGFVLILYVLLALGISGRYPGVGVITAFKTDLLNDIDIWNYQRIAEDWYSEAAGYAVFLPFYPGLIRAFAVTGNFFLASVIISGLCAVGSGVYLYRLVLLDRDSAAAARAVKYMYIFPAGFFLAAPLAGNVSLFFSVVFMYLVRKRYHWAAALAGFCAALCDVYGILLISAAAVEAYDEFRGRAAAKKAEAAYKHALPMILPLAGILSGFFCYLYINHIYYGNGLYFLGRRHSYFERSTWYFWDTASYLTEITKVWLSTSPRIAYAVSIPNLACMFMILVLFTCAVNKIRLSYIFYGICYFLLYFGVLGELNGPRNAAGLFPLAVSAAALTESRVTNTAVTLVYAAAFAVYFYFNVCV